MATDTLYVLTLLTNFLCMAFALWFAIYLLARSQANQLTFRAVIALIALAFYYNGAFIALVNPTANIEHIRSISVIIALVAIHDLTFRLLPLPQQRRHYGIAWGFILLSIIVVILHFMVPPGGFCDPRFNCPVEIITPMFILDLFKFLLFLGILYNLWQIKLGGGLFEHHTFYLALLLGASTIGFHSIGTILNISYPRFITNLLVLVAIALLAYSVTRHQTLVARRTTVFDLPVTLLTVALILGIYLFVAWRIGLPLTAILLLAVLAIFTHSSYDFVREFLDRLFRLQERILRRELRKMAKDATQNKSLIHYLRRALAILCDNLMALNGFIAIRQLDQFEVVASLHSIAVGTQFPPKEIILEEITQPTNALASRVAWLAPVYAGGEQLAVIGIGERKDQSTYSQEELYWLEDFADEMGLVVKANLQPGSDSKGAQDISAPGVLLVEGAGLETNDFLATFAVKLDPEYVKSIEDGFRNIHDYSYLGSSPLVELFEIKGKDHIECGKQVQQKLVQILEKLRPVGKPPTEPFPHEWHDYTILHEAYIEDIPAREIMARLYISEGTYYRTRRKALRGIARALLEAQTAG